MTKVVTTKARRPLLLLLALTLAGCSTVAPFETAQPGPDRFAVCYTPLHASPPQLQQIAGRECTGKTTPHLVGQGTDLSACPLLTPERAVFACGPG